MTNQTNNNFFNTPMLPEIFADEHQRIAYGWPVPPAPQDAWHPARGVEPPFPKRTVEVIVSDTLFPQNPIANLQVANPVTAQLIRRSLVVAPSLQSAPVARPSQIQNCISNVANILSSFLERGVHILGNSSSSEIPSQHRQNEEERYQLRIEEFASLPLEAINPTTIGCELRSLREEFEGHYSEDAILRDLCSAIIEIREQDLISEADVCMSDERIEQEVSDMMQGVIEENLDEEQIRHEVHFLAHRRSAFLSLLIPNGEGNHEQSIERAVARIGRMLRNNL